MKLTSFHCFRNKDYIEADALSRPSEVSDRLKVGGGQHHHPHHLFCPSPISKLRVEKIEGGLMVAGVVVAANCQIILPIFGFLFLLVGVVLTAASYRGPGKDEEPESYAERIAFTGNSRILGPACMVVGLLMLISSCILCALTRRARRREQTVGFHCPLHGDFYPLSPLTSSKTLDLFDRNNKCSFCWPRKRGIGAIAVGPPQCPHSQVSSTRSSIASSPHSQCPTPLPFLVNTGPSLERGLVVTSTAQQSPAEQTFGSIRSLTVGREIASFPMSRTPTPPVLEDRSQNMVHVPDHQMLVESHFETVPVHHQGPRKSVSIILPYDGPG